MEETDQDDVYQTRGRGTSAREQSGSHQNAAQGEEEEAEFYVEWVGEVEEEEEEEEDEGISEETAADNAVHVQDEVVEEDEVEEEGEVVLGLDPAADSNGLGIEDSIAEEDSNSARPPVALSSLQGLAKLGRSPPRVSEVKHTGGAAGMELKHAGGKAFVIAGTNSPTVSSGRGNPDLRKEAILNVISKNAKSSKMAAEARTHVAAGSSTRSERIVSNSEDAGSSSAQKDDPDADVDRPVSISDSGSAESQPTLSKDGAGSGDSWPVRKAAFSAPLVVGGSFVFKRICRVSVTQYIKKNYTNYYFIC
jgi:hypothetical protein